MRGRRRDFASVTAFPRLAGTFLDLARFDDVTLRLDIQLLRALVEVARARSFTRAAAQLDLTPAAVSWQVKRLEDRVGRELLCRMPDGVTPTTAGRELLTRAQRILRAHDKAVMHFTHESSLKGRVRFGCVEDLMASRLGRLLRRFRSLNPEIQLETVIDVCSSLRQRVGSGDLDVAVMPIPRGDTTVGRVLWSEQPRWVCSQTWSGHWGGALPVVLFNYRSMYAQAVIQQLESHALDWYPVIECSTAAGMKAAITMGVGVGVLSPRQSGHQLAPVPDTLDLPAPPRCEYILLRSEPEPTPSVAALIELIVDELEGATAID